MLAGQLLGYLVLARGIEANPAKIQAIMTMAPPKDRRGVQQLTGHLAALSCFISRPGEKALPFYHLMKKTKEFEWTDEAQNVFANLKKVLSTPPILVVPREK